MGFWSEIKETVEDVVEGVADWFTREEETPEILVLGAELHCMYGSKNTYLIVNGENIRFNGLPAACVLDRAESYNIMYFGVCHQNGYCSDLMKLRERWENEEPQNAGLNGEEFITTESVLICERCGGRIQAVNSGQDRIGAERLNQELSLLARMQDQYPGLLEVISDPNGSLYLTEGMYDKAMAFVRECWENNGCNMEIISLFDQSSPEREMMRNVMERLLKSFDMSSVDKFRDDLISKGTEKGYDGVPGWNVDVLNQEMFLLLEDECEITKKRLEEEPFYRWQEEHRSFMYTLSDAATLLTYFVAANKGFGSEKDSSVTTRETGDEQSIKKNKGDSRGDPRGYSNQEEPLFRNVHFKKNDIKMVDAAAREAGVNRVSFRKCIHELKQEMGMRPNQNFTYKELLDIAEDLKYK